MIKVIHKKDSFKYKNVFYIGRGSVLGNPYTSIKNRETKAEFVVDSRDESIENFKNYLNDCINRKDKEVCDILNKIYRLQLEEDVYLSCFCKPKSCHGDVIKEVIESKIKNRIEIKDQLNLFED